MQLVSKFIDLSKLTAEDEKSTDAAKLKESNSTSVPEGRGHERQGLTPAEAEAELARRARTKAKNMARSVDEYALAHWREIVGM